MNLVSILLLVCNFITANFFSIDHIVDKINQHKFYSTSNIECINNYEKITVSGYQYADVLKVNDKRGNASTDVSAKLDKIKFGNSKVEILDTKVNVLIPGSKNTALYFTVKNHSQDLLIIKEVHCDDANKVELHITKTGTKGISYMTKVENFIVQPNGSMKLKPGHNHVMLIGLKRKISKGDIMNFTLHTAAHGNIKISAVVQDVHLDCCECE